MSRRVTLGWPSFGFLLLLTSHLALFALIAWGWQKPVLDQAFEILTRRDLANEAEFSRAEVGLLQRMWAMHPGLGRALTGRSSIRFLEPTVAGWLARPQAHLAVRPEKERPTQFSLEAKGQAQDFPIAIEMRGKGLTRKFELSSAQALRVEFSVNELKQPTILDFDVSAARRPGNAAPSWAVRVVAAPSPSRENP